MGDGQCVHPDAPAAPLILDGVVEQNAEDGVHHLGDFLLLAVFWIDEAQREHPVLPYGALQQAPAAKQKSMPTEEEEEMLRGSKSHHCRD